MLSSTLLSQVQVPQTLPPILIIAFNRPDTLEQVLRSLSDQSLLPDKVIAYVDGPRGPSDIEKVQQCIDLLTGYRLPGSLELHVRSQNHGMNRNTLEAISEALTSHESVVVIEDDILPNPFFYELMVKLLSVYSEEKNIFSISGYAHWRESDFSICYEKEFNQIQEQLSTDFICINRLIAWGWATWADRWQKAMSNQMTSKLPYFSLLFRPLYPYTYQLNYFLISQIIKRKLVWDTPLALNCLLKGYIHLCPQYSMIRNIGFGEEATHTKSNTYSLMNQSYRADFCPESLPESLQCHPIMLKPLSLLALVRLLIYRIKEKLAYST